MNIKPVNQPEICDEDHLPRQKDSKWLRKEFWGRHLWARDYFVATTGNVTDKVAKKHTELQDVDPQDDGFKISE